ncbi:hypothetical protein L9F63_005319, partial [Diploptera punctata]
ELRSVVLVKFGWLVLDDLNTTDSAITEVSTQRYDNGNNESATASKVFANGSELIMAKIVAMLVLGICSFALGILPVKLASWLRWNKETVNTRKSSHFVISLLLCFGGGVLLYTTFLHLQPEVRESMSFLQDGGIIPDFGHGTHLAELVFCAGFFFVYLVEELVHAVLDRRSHEREDEAVLHRTMSLRRSSKKTLAASGENLDNVVTNGSTGSSMSASTQGLLNNSLSTITILDNDDDMSTSSSTVAKSFRGLLAVLALSFHAVFEGLAVGLETSVGNVWYLFAAIATHKLVIAFCVGVELISTRTKLVLIFVYLATFAAVTPLGIGVGIALSNDGDGAGTSTVATVVLQGMAAGTLLYVVFFEVLQRERANTQSGIWQLVAIMAGFAVMFALQLISY